MERHHVHHVDGGLRDEVTRDDEESDLLARVADNLANSKLGVGRRPRGAGRSELGSPSWSLSAD